jgi:membrane protein implicated in regulation of membrane protease activity
MALVPIMDAIVGDTNPPELRSITTSVRQLVGVVTSSIGIFMVGQMQAAQGTFTWATIVFSCVGVLSVLALLPVRRFIRDEMADLNVLLERRARDLAAEQIT